MILATARSRVSDERGAVFMLVALGLLAMVLIVALVLNTAGWFVRHRHLQLQADAGALAGAVAFNGCAASASAGDPKIVGFAHQYAGDLTSAAPYTPVHNEQIAADASVLVRVNSANYGASGSDNSDPAGAPCTAGYVDVKVTDSKLPWFFAPGIHLNTHARVSILQLSRLNGSLPLAVQDVNPRAVGAIFVNEDSGNAILARSLLTPGTTTQTLNGQPLLPWTGSAVPVSVSSASRHVGVVIALCSNKRICATSTTSGWLTSPASISALCAQVFVTCDSSTQTGLDLIHGYDSAAGTTAAPKVGNVALTSSGCDDSAPYFFLNGDCTIGGTVDVDFGLTTDPTRSTTATPPAGVNAAVFLECNGGNSICPNNKKSCAMTYQGTTGTISHWSASGCIKINSGAGQAKLDARVTWTTRANNVNTTHELKAPDPQATDVARPFANDGVNGTFFASTLGSYPIAYTQVWQNSSCTGSGAHSVPFGTTSFCVGIGIAGNLKNAADFNDPTRVLKFFQTGSTGAVDCLNGNLENQIEVGCDLSVQLNTGEACPNSTLPVDCLDTYQGKSTGQVKHGMDQRFGCTANNWIAANIPPGGSVPTVPTGDRRAVPLLVTLYGAFEVSGRHSIPITDYAAFYVTGWSGSSCAYNQPAPPGADSQSSIWGHFIKYIGNFSTSSGGPGCDFTALAPCITVMTK
jgi:hypothetical protein